MPPRSAKPLKLDAIWKSEWLVGITVSLLFAAAYSSDLVAFSSLDNLIYDSTIRMQAKASDDRIVLVEIDTDNGAQQNQLNLSTALKQLSNSGVKAVALDALFSEPGIMNGNPLAEEIRQSGHVLLPLYLEIGGAMKSNIILPEYVKRSAIRQINHNESATAPVSASLLNHPYREISEGAYGFGHFNILADNDGIVRSLPMAIDFSGQYYPSMALSLMALATNIPQSDLRLNLGIDIEVGAMNIATDSRGRIYPRFYSDPLGHTFQRIKLSELLKDNELASMLGGKIILIGAQASSDSNSFRTPLKNSMSRIEFTAHCLQSTLREEQIIRPAWSNYLELSLLLLAAFYISLLLPRLSMLTGMATTGTIVILLLAASYTAISAYSLWIQSALIILLLLAGQFGIAIRAHLLEKEQKPVADADPNKMNKTLGLSFQNQGMLEEAYKKFLACELNDEMMETFYDLALAFERKRQFDEAISVYYHMASVNRDYRDIQERIINAKNTSESIQDKGTTNAITTLLASGEVTTLGRYEIESELGKGAMGTVFLGRDPQINRKVAIKTLALSKEFDPNQLKEVKERFFHEAEIAGMLNHPNIVTIFDAGAEHDLAYIAMEYLDGINLTAYTKKETMLPLTTILKIAAKVAEALQYAHDHGVIHRDIKPANIMILKNKSVKVTDFGIAHINESGKTKAGIVLGTPSYMSPEQLSGKKIDGRSDLFSLGVMLYEMVTGVRPFLAESISKLMFKIAKSPHADVRELNHEIPDCVADLINNLLTKQADLRIATARDVGDRIYQCLQIVRSKEEKQ